MAVKNISGLDKKSGKRRDGGAGAGAAKDAGKPRPDHNNAVAGGRCRLVLSRRRETAATTFGEMRLFVDGVFVPDAVWQTCEKILGTNERRKNCIPLGRYPIEWRTRGRFFQRYAKRWGHAHVFEIADVPNRSDILFHVGTHEGNSLGCILVGFGMLCDHTASTPPQKSERLFNSRAAYVDFYEAVTAAKCRELVVREAGGFLRAA